MSGVAALLVLLAWIGLAQAHLYMNITVPFTYKVTGVDAYVCTVVELPPEPHKLVGVVPRAEQKVVHHILLYGCTKPFKMPEGPHGEKAVAWDCMNQPTCAEGGWILYGWGRNAPHLELPAGVGYSVGTGTSIRYIVAQVHFLAERPADDASGVTLVMHSHATNYAAGLLTYASGFAIPPRTKSTLVDNECCYQGHQQLTTFAFRVHTHTLGRSVYMTRDTWNHTGREVVAVNNPQLPQAFYPVKQQVIWPGDKLKVTCDFDSSDRKDVVYAGSTHNDEMCNMYMMVYGFHPNIVACDGNSFGVSEDTPGVLPRTASFVPDPCPFWQPPVQPDAPAGKTAAAAQKAAGAKLGDITGITLTGDGQLWGLFRGARHWEADTFDMGTGKIRDATPLKDAVVAHLDDQTGAVVSSFGAGLFVMPHMITTDRESNLWIADVGLHQIFKFDKTGKQLLVVGEKGVPGNSPKRFCMPSQVAAARDGSFFVSDGYCNNRVVRFDKNGRFLGEATVPRVDGSNQPPVPHAVLLDECRNRVYVAAREARKVHEYEYDPKGSSIKLVSTVDLSRYGRVWSLHMGPYGLALALVWELGQDARLVNLQFGDQHWVLPGMRDQFPHDIALGAAPTALSGASDRLFALYVAPTCGVACGGLRRFILSPHGWKLPPKDKLVVSTNHEAPGMDHAHSADSHTTTTTAPDHSVAIHTHAHTVVTPVATQGMVGTTDNAPDTKTTSTSTKTTASSKPGKVKPSGTTAATTTTKGVQAAMDTSKQGNDPGAAAKVLDQTAATEEEEEDADDTDAVNPEIDGDDDGFEGNPDDVDVGSKFLLLVGPKRDVSSIGKVIGVLVLTVGLVGGMAVLGLRAVRQLYPSAPAGGVGAGTRYQKTASIDEMLAQSAAMEGIEHGGTALGGSEVHLAGQGLKHTAKANGANGVRDV